MTPRRCLRAVLAGLLVLAGCGSSHPEPVTSGRPDHASATPTRISRDELGTAARFAAAYVRSLDGAEIANGLPDATPSVRALAGQSGAISVRRRRGTLLLTELRPAVGGAVHSYTVTARDAAHTFYAQITLAKRHGRWLVVELTPPDFAQVFAPPGPPAPAAPGGSAAALHTVRVFLRGYLEWLYGRASLGTVTAATGGLLAGLDTRPPRIPPGTRSLHPAVEAIAMQPRGRGWRALPNISDGRETYQLVLAVARTRAGWLVSNVSLSDR